VSIEGVFPNLRADGYGITSPQTSRYNCIAWAAGDDHRWWEPFFAYGYWPPEATQERTLAAYQAAYETLGYDVADSGVLEASKEKIAIYVDSWGVPTHAARQLADGRWTSKLGQSYDVWHGSPKGVTGDIYGQVALFMSRNKT
jgi:hypothetical protein